MASYFGWTGRLLRVDLTRMSHSVEEWDRSWIGGKAFGVWKLFEEEPADCEDFDPRRILIISCGPLTGTPAPSSSRANVSNRNLSTGGMSTSSIGGLFPAEMKFAGYDHVLISGKAEAPVYLYIHNEEVRILDASELWGRDTWETDSILKRRHADPDMRVACIGPAGENLVRYACIIGERNRAASWGGNGAVMGAKNLKAIAVRGTRPVRIADPSACHSSVQKARRKLEQAMGVKLLRRGGTVGVISPGLNPLAFKNYLDDRWDEAKAGELTYKRFRNEYGGRPVGCFNCSIACGRFFEVKDGRYAGIRMEGVQLNALRGLGSNLDITAPDEIIKANAVVNQYGLGIDGLSAVAGWVFDCFEKGLITERDLGYRVKWGDIESFLKVTEDVTLRRGLGDDLAEGIAHASKVVGRGSEKLALLIKGAEVNEGRLRSNRAWALGIVTSLRGGGHLDGAPAMEGVGLPDKLCSAAYGIPNANDTTAYEHKATFVVFTERLKMLVDSLGVCYYTSIWADPTELDPNDYAELYSGITGDRCNAGDLMDLAEKAINVEKAFNTLHGHFTREDDDPPFRLVHEAVKSGPFRGTSIDMEKWAQMLTEYYELHGWDKRTGLQKPERLKESGLGAVADRLDADRRLF